MTESPDSMIDQLVLGRYRIVQLLAQGGMGAVYLARVEGSAGFAKPVVVKRILPHLSGSADDKAQFVREAQILSNLRHPGIVNVIDFGRLEDAHLMVLEYVHGYHLGQWMKYVIQSREKMPWEACIYVMLQVLAALHYAHTYARSDGSRATIIHRDISPANILIDVDGSVRLADFGIARMEAEQTAQNRRSETIFKGKFPYAAPELFAGEKATPSTDIYACGVVLYQLLSGSNPFSGQEAAAIIRRVLTFTPPPPSTLRPDLPSGLDDVLDKALAKEAKGRYPSAKDFATALRGLLRQSEQEVAAEVAAMIRADFTGDMPRMLKRHTLEELEEAWRKVASLSNIPMISSMPPTLRVGNVFGLNKEANSTTLGTISAAQSGGEAGARSNVRFTVAVVGAALLAAGVATAAVLGIRSRETITEPRFLVVESGADRHESTAALGEAAGSSTATAAQKDLPVQLVPSSTANTRQARGDERPRDLLTGLSLAFAKRQSAIQSCFRSHANEVTGSPEVSIRFSIDGQGKVASAAVRPAALAATPLGQCLEQVARSTDFGPQDKPLVFSIPITARAH
jgi:eukaryotic-like serine/threonine-protein kinase